MENKDPKVIIEEIKKIPEHAKELTLHINSVHMKFIDNFTDVLKVIPKQVTNLALHGQKFSQKKRQFIECMIGAVPAHVASIELVLNEPFNDHEVVKYLNSCKKVLIVLRNDGVSVRKRPFFTNEEQSDDAIKQRRLEPDSENLGTQPSSLA